ncbi:MAG: fumarylacetoacetate hydrolase family protein [Flavobacteriales bacterium]|nr:fumarylacetoacetate hydrolase family protein [Flavobacteriales bacterium]MDW8409887.1 fumarylacetoacetate hydrolase family protein [Flavobacteriales bacterium]
MKIICIGRNYSEHAREMAAELPQEPVFFLKPDTALLRTNRPFYIPDFTQEVHYEGELVFRICKNGKHIPERLALSYVDAVAVGVDFTARDVQNELKRKGLPWEKAKAFDGSAACGHFFMLSDFGNLLDLNLELRLNGQVKQKAATREMLFPVSYLIGYVSRFITLRQGDLLYTGTPAGVGPVAIGDEITGFINGRLSLRMKIK